MPPLPLCARGSRLAGISRLARIPTVTQNTSDTLIARLPELPVAAASDIAGLEPMQSLKRRWPSLLGGALTIAMFVFVVRKLLATGVPGLLHALPDSPMFYVVFAALYMSLPLGDYAIFRRLWRIPVSGLVALMKKRVANEVLLGYSGEAYFYAWARQRSEMVAAPFGAVKDVSILSAIAGNGMTLLMMAIALPLGYDLLGPERAHQFEWSALIIMAMSLPFLIFSRKVFTLPRAQLWEVFGIHVARLVAGSVLIAMAWHFALPQVPVAMWLFLAAGRLLVSRLPFVPNKDLLFAAFANQLIGQHQELSQLVAVTAALTLIVHVVLVTVFGVVDLMMRKKDGAV